MREYTPSQLFDWEQACFVKFSGAKRPQEEADNSFIILSLLSELTYQTHLGQWGGATDVLRAMWQLLRGYTGQGSMGRGAEAWPTADKGERPYMLAQGWAMARSRDQHNPACAGVQVQGLIILSPRGFSGIGLCSGQDIAGKLGSGQVME